MLVLIDYLSNALFWFCDIMQKNCKTYINWLMLQEYHENNSHVIEAIFRLLKLSKSCKCTKTISSIILKCTRCKCTLKIEIISVCKHQLIGNVIIQIGSFDQFDRSITQWPCTNIFAPVIFLN